MTPPCWTAAGLILELIVDKRSQADRILIAQLTGTAKRHAGWRELSGEEEAAVVAELRELPAGLTDLLAEIAGLAEGFGEGQLDEPRARQAADLCRKAGADPEAIPAWIEEGRRRRDAADVRRVARRVNAALKHLQLRKLPKGVSRARP